MSGSRYNHRSIDSVGIHTTLIIVVHSDQRPVGDDASNTDLAIRTSGASDKILDASGVEELNVGELEDF